MPTTAVGASAGNLYISKRPPVVEWHRQPGHWEIDTDMGNDARNCVLTLVERATGVKFYFATPHHAWQR